MPLGYSDLKTVLRLPANWDLTYLKKWSLKDGTSFDALARRVGTALTLFNRSLTQSYMAQYIQTTTEMSMEYDTGGESAVLAEVSEYGRPDPIYGDFTGHMLPLHDYGGALGWTYMALRRGNMSRFDRDIARLIQRSTNLWQNRVLWRMFTSAAETVGASGKSVPFADGGTADAAYIPPSYEGRNFLYTHNHFLRNADDATGRSAALVAMGAHLKEHGVNPPWDLIISETDKAVWVAQTEFKKPVRDVFTTAGVETRALVPEETYIGILETSDGWFRVRPEPRLPTKYSGAFKPAGYNNPGAPLLVRTEDGFPLGLVLVATIQNFPLQDAIAYFTFGIGVGDRVAGVCNYAYASGNYVDPTIT
jgi:hypothetical protein